VPEAATLMMKSGAMIDMNKFSPEQLELFQI
jgi:hypothetical protein